MRFPAMPILISVPELGAAFAVISMSVMREGTSASCSNPFQQSPHGRLATFKFYVAKSRLGCLSDSSSSYDSIDFPNVYTFWLPSGRHAE